MVLRRQMSHYSTDAAGAFSGSAPWPGDLPVPISLARLRIGMQSAQREAEAVDSFGIGFDPDHGEGSGDD